MVPRPQRYRKVIYFCMDAFNATVEQRNRPQLSDQPVLLCAPPHERGRIESACPASLARGVRLGMPVKTALRLCPHAVRLDPAPETYNQAREELVALCRDHTDLIESAPQGIYLDVTYNAADIPLGQRLARLLKDDMRRQLGFITAMGLGPNKLVAQLAAAQAFPDGLTVVHADQAADFLAELPVDSLTLLDRPVRRRLADLEIATCGQLAALDHRLLTRHFGPYGARLWAWSRGRDDRPVTPDAPPERLSQEALFPTTFFNLREIHLALDDLATRLDQRLRRRQLTGRRLTLTVRYPNQRSLNYSCPFTPGTDARTALITHARALLRRTDAREQGVRQLTLAVSGFESGLLEQLDLFVTASPHRP